MLTKDDLATPTVIEGWLQDMALKCIPRTDPASNWMLEFTVPAQNPLVLSVVNPKVIPRGIMFVCGMLAAPGHEAAFNKLDDARRVAFWRQLRTSLSREFVEFQAEGVITECPKSIRITAVRFDDGLTLDSFSRTLSSVCKAVADAMMHFNDFLGDPAPPATGEFAFKKTGTQ